VTIGIVVAQIFGLEWILGTNDLWPYALAAGAVPAAAQILIAMISPESPAWLAANGKVEEAEQVQISLKGSEQLVQPEKPEKEVGLIENIKNIFANPPVRAACIQVLIYMMIQQLSGINAVFFYSGSIFKSAGIPASLSGVATVGLGAINVAGVFVAVALITKTGRLTLFSGVW